AALAMAILLLAPVRASAAEDARTLAFLLRAFEARQYREVLDTAPGIPRSLQRDGVWLAALALEKGPEAAVAFATKGGLPIDERRPREHRRALGGATYRCMGVRRYDAARVLFVASLEGLPSDPESQRNVRERYGLQMAALFSGLRRREDLQIPASDPRSPVIEVLALIFGLRGDTSRVFVTDFGVTPPVAWPRQAAPVPGGASLGLEDFLLPPETQFDLFLAVADFATTGDSASGWRVRIGHPFAPANLEFFVVPDGAATRILGLAVSGGRPLLWGLGTRARLLADAGDIAAARMLVVWAHDTVGRSTEPRWNGFLERSTPDAVVTAEGVRSAAAALAETRGATGPSDAAFGQYAALSFGEGMTRPILRSSPNGKPAPEYPLEARQAGVSGLVIIKCTITVEGRAEDCTIVKGLGSAVDQAVLRWLAGASWSPVTFRGKPVRVSYVFNFKLSLLP
ncbi:MAG TPA: energy transducer TonB, partial [Myxococcaceae bacterium]|nr:energy transducer TonB [Myxococcaceae bacterium]